MLACARADKRVRVSPPRPAAARQAQLAEKQAALEAASKQADVPLAPYSRSFRRTAIADVHAAPGKGMALVRAGSASLRALCSPAGSRLGRLRARHRPPARTHP